MTSRRQDRTIRLAHLRNRHLTATETALNTVGTHNRQTSPKTVGSRLRETGLRARRPYVGLPLTHARRLRRMALLTAHAPRLFPMRQWRRVLFTDESRFTFYRADGRRPFTWEVKDKSDSEKSERGKLVTVFPLNIRTPYHSKISTSPFFYS